MSRELITGNLPTKDISEIQRILLEVVDEIEIKLNNLNIRLSLLEQEFYAHLK